MEPYPNNPEFYVALLTAAALVIFAISRKLLKKP